MNFLDFPDFLDCYWRLTVGSQSDRLDQAQQFHHLQLGKQGQKMPKNLGIGQGNEARSGFKGKAYLNCMASVY